MADSNISIWFDLQVSTGTGEKFNSNSRGGMAVTKVAIGSVIVRNIYTGDLGNGKSPPMGFWEWIPKCISDDVCSYPLPEHWKKTMRGGWSWENMEYGKEIVIGDEVERKYLALAKEKPKGTKIGAIADFKPEDFKGYNPKEVKSRDMKVYGYWVINDGELNLSGTWQFVNLIYK